MQWNAIYKDVGIAIQQHKYFNRCSDVRTDSICFSNMDLFYLYTYICIYVMIVIQYTI